MSAVRRLPWREIGVAAGALATLIFVAAIEVRQRAAQAPVEVSYSSYDFADGGYRGWYELLEREGVQVIRFEQRPAFLDRSISTLVLADAPGSATALTAADVAALDAWIRQGGRALVVGDGPDLVRVGRLLRRGDRLVHVDRSRRIAGYAVGRGELVRVRDAARFTNAAIGTGPHARLAYDLARPREPLGVVAFDEAIHGHLVPERWWQIAPRPFVVGLAIALVAIALAIAGAAIRLGPPLPPPAPPEPASGEFLSALAALYERTGARLASIRRLRASCTHRLARVEPANQPAELATAYAELCALADRDSATDVMLVRAARLALGIRKELASR